MMKRVLMLAATAGLAAACASSGGGAVGGTTDGAVSLAGATTTVSNMAASTSWSAEERLLPQNPILALVAEGGSIDSPAGVSFTCNPDSGALTGRLGMQANERLGEDATYAIRLGARVEKVKGAFETDAATGGTEFVFSPDTQTVRQMSVLDSVTILDDKGVAQWALVSDPGTQINAKYVGSLSGIDQATQDFLFFCNPK